AVLVLLPFIAGIQAKNDWSVPCTSGSCSYDLPSTNEAASSGSLKIWGGVDAITDITNAADWEILDCNSTALAQDIRLVCKTDPDDPNSKCGHLYQNIGAVDKIVRLPESCGASAFARIAKAWVPDDQSIPEAVQKRLVRRAGVPPVVKALHIDTNFDSVKWSKTGMVNIAIQGANVPGLDMSITTNTGSQARRITGRVTSVAVAAATNVAGAATQAAGAVADTATAAAGAVKDAISNKTSVDVNKSFDIPPIQFDKNVNLINSAISCLGESLSLNVNMDASADMQATLSVVALGTVVPPKMTKFSVTAVMNGQVGGTIDMTADISGSLDSGRIPLINIGIPGLDFPGILTVGPSFTVDAEISGQVDITMDMTVGVNMDLSNATIAFPPDKSNAPSGNSFSLGDTPLTINAAPDVQATGTITAILSPSLNFGITALGGKGQAEVFLAVDASAAMTMNFDGSA
ncbi:hypothetical protein C8F01DRAFT_958388, partial [Mycena amicta]